MKVVHGIPVSPGIIFGEAFVQETEGFRIPKQFVDAGAFEAEIRRFHGALEQAQNEIILNRDSTRSALGQTFADIFEAQLQLLLEPKLTSSTEELIRSRHFTAEHAVSVVIGKHVTILRGLENSYIAEKANDLRDIEKRLLRHLLGARKELLSDLSAPIVLLARNLTPSETANLNREFVKAIVTEEGGSGGHTAILAAALEIPAVVGAGSFVNDVSGGDTIIVDGNSGIVVVRPDDSMTRKYHRIIESDTTRIESLDSFRDVEAITTDGTRIEVHANIEFPHEVANVLQRGADGIGLFRTEFLYLTQTEDPSEEDHYSAYKHVAEAMGGKPVVIRTFDFGDDKLADRHAGQFVEHNPALGLRGIRLALKRWELFRCQLRAILRASVYGDIRIMFPLISTVKEFKQARNTVLNDTMDELRDEGIPFNADIRVGMMVEVPAAVIMLDHFAEDADFFSIGTNDLTQYTMAVDRGNRNVVHLFNSEDPAVLRLIRQIALVSKREGIPLSLCGQMGGDPYQVVLLIGLGLRSISCAPSSIAGVKQICRRVSVENCRAIAQKALRCSNVRDVKDYVRNKLRKLVPDLWDVEEP